MNRQTRSPRAASPKSRRGALCLLLLVIPAVLIGPLLGSTLLISHTHGDEAPHGHLVPKRLASSGHRVLEAIHHARHDVHDAAHIASIDAGEHEGHPGESPFDDLRGTPFPAWRATVSGGKVVDLSWQPVARHLTGAVVGGSQDSSANPAPDHRRAFYDPPPTRGVERVLRSSGAVLI